MTIFLRKLITDNGDVVFPLSEMEVTSTSVGRFVSDSGKYYMPIFEEIVPIVGGNPMGLLLTLTYSATP